MSLHAYGISREIVVLDPPFSAIIMAALRKADTVNAAKIRLMWPEIADEMERRYDEPGGILPEERDHESEPEA